MCNLDQVIQPNEKLQKMLTFAKIILIINLLSSCLRFFISFGDILTDLFCCLFLFLAIYSVYFVYASIYLIIALINAVYIVISVALWFQMMIQKTLGNTTITLRLCLLSYLMIFYIFAIIFMFPIYKEMRAQAMEAYGAVDNGNQIAREDVRRDDDPEQRPPQQSGQRGFVAFAGQGTQVGGN